MAIDALLGAVIYGLANDHEGSARAERWTRFVDALVAQLDAEDELVAALPYERDVRVLVQEHRFLRARLSELGDAMRRGEPVLGALRMFRDVLLAHARNDDRLLYGWVEGALGRERRTAVREGLERRMQRVTG